MFLQEQNFKNAIYHTEKLAWEIKIFLTCGIDVQIPKARSITAQTSALSKSLTAEEMTVKKSIIFISTVKKFKNTAIRRGV